MTTKRFYIFIVSLLLCLQFTAAFSLGELKQYDFELMCNHQKSHRNVVALFNTTQCYKPSTANQPAGFKVRTIISSLHGNYYAVYWDAAQQEDIDFENELFKFIPTGNKTGLPPLAEQLGNINCDLPYPTLCIRDPNNRNVLRRSGFLTQNELMLILRKLE